MASVLSPAARSPLLREEQGVALADCKIWLEHADRGILLEGTATVVLPM